MSKKYQVYKDAAGKYRFRLKAENNKIIAVGQAYEQHTSCINGIKSIQANCGAEVEDLTANVTGKPNPKYQIFYDASCGYRFHLNARNGEIIATSEGYETKDGCLNGVEAVRKSCDAEIEDLTRAKKMEKDALVTPKPAEEPIVEEAVDYGEIAKACAEEEKMGGLDQTKLELKCPASAIKHEVAVFQGKLVKSCSGEGIANAKIEIWEKDRSLLGDDYLAYGNTAEDGSFNINWKARPLAWFDNTGKIYARFRGNKESAPSVSEIRAITIN